MQGKCHQQAEDNLLLWISSEERRKSTLTFAQITIFLRVTTASELLLRKLPTSLVIVVNNLSAFTVQPRNSVLNDFAHADS